MPGLPGNLCRDLLDARADDVEFAFGRDQRHHDLQQDRPALVAFGLDSSLKNGARLHLVDFRMGDSQAAAAVAQHRVQFLQRARAQADVLDIRAHMAREILEFPVAGRQEFVKRRIEKTHGNGQARHDAEEFDEVSLLHRQDSLERTATPFDVFGHDHLAHGDDALVLEEHVLRPAKPDTLGAEFPCPRRVGRRLGIGPDLEPPCVIGPRHECHELFRKIWFAGRDFTRDHLAGGTVDGDHVAPPDRDVADTEEIPVRFDPDRAGTGDAWSPHAASHPGRRDSSGHHAS